MADISLLSRLLNGVQRNVDLSQNSLVVGSLKVGSVSPSELTQTILDNLINLQNGSDFANGTNSHTHDGRYYTESELTSRTAASGATLVAVERKTYSNITGYTTLLGDTLGNYNIQALIDAINTSLGTAAASEFLDDGFRINDDGDPTKQIAFEAAGISTGTTRTITMPDADVDLDDVNNAILKDGSRAFTANQPMGGFKLTGLAAGSGAGDSVRYEQAILASGVNPFAANQSMGGFKLTNLADPTAAQDAVTLNYLSARLAGLKPKQSARVGSLTNVVIASELENGDILDGITLATGDRVLLMGQTAPEENGIYIVQASGAAVRSSDFDSLSPIDEVNGAWLPVQEGSLAGKTFVQYGTVATLGTDPINFEYWNPIADLIGGDMITKTGSTFSVDLATVSGLESSNPGNVAGQLRVKLQASNPSLFITGSNELGVKLDPAGAILSGASGIAAQVDNSSIEISSNALRVKAAGITAAHLAAAVAGSGLSNSGTALDVNVDNSTIEINSDSLRVKDAGITAAKLNSNVADQDTITGGAGSALAVQSAPLAKKTMVAGEAFAANTSFLVRFAVSGETAGRVYKADKDASVSDKFWCVGVAFSTSAVSAGQNLTVIILGSHTLQSSDSAFAGGDIGKPVWLQSSGAFSTTPPSSANQANFKIGMVESTTKIWVDPQMMGVY